MIARLNDYLTKQNDLILEMIKNVDYELKNFHKFNANQLYEISEAKEELMENFISLKGEIDIYINNHKSEISENENLFKTIKKNMDIFKEKNKKLLLITLGMKELYDNIIENTEETNIINMEI